MYNVQVFPEGSYGGFWIVGLFMVASVATGARLHVIVMHLARHAYRKYYNHTGELQRSKSAQPSEYLPPIHLSSQIERSETQSPHNVSAHFKGESSMRHMKQARSHSCTAV